MSFVFYQQVVFQSEETGEILKLYKLPDLGDKVDIRLHMIIPSTAADVPRKLSQLPTLQVISPADCWTSICYIY